MVADILTKPLGPVKFKDLDMCICRAGCIAAGQEESKTDDEESGEDAQELVGGVFGWD